MHSSHEMPSAENSRFPARCGHYRSRSVVGRHIVAAAVHTRPDEAEAGARCLPVLHVRCGLYTYSMCVADGAELDVDRSKRHVMQVSLKGTTSHKASYALMTQRHLDTNDLYERRLQGAMNGITDKADFFYETDGWVPSKLEIICKDGLPEKLSAVKNDRGDTLLKETEDWSWVDLGQVQTKT